MESILKEAVGFNGIKGGITKEGSIVKTRVEGKEIREYRPEGRRITNGFILIRGIRFLFYRHLRMCGLKITIEESDVTDDTEAVSKDGKLVSIAEMAVDVELFCIRAGSSLGGHKAISHLVRINPRLVFIVRLEAADEGVKGFGVIFGDIEFNAGGIESKHGGKGGIDSPADGFREIDHMLEHQINIRKEVLLKAGEKRGIRHLGKATEIP